MGRGAANKEEDWGAPGARFQGTVLIVDDDDAFVRQLRGTLKELGLGAESASSLDEGLARLSLEGWEPGRYDWVLLDIFLKDETCEPLTYAVWRLEPRPGLVVMTGFVDAERIEAAKENAFVLMKPFNSKQLISVLEATRPPHVPAPTGFVRSSPVPPVAKASPPHTHEKDDDLPLIRRGPQYLYSVCGRSQILAFGRAPVPAWLLRYWGNLKEPDPRYWHPTAVDPTTLDFAEVALVLVDESLEGEAILTYCEKLREAGLETPLLLTGQSSYLDGPAHRAGADHFAKTGTPEVGTHANALLRNLARHYRTTPTVELDDDRNEIIINGRRRRVTTGGYRIFRTIHAAAPHTVSVDEIIRQAYDAHVSEEAPRTAITRLRNELGSDGRLIVNVKGKGYRFGK